MCGVQETVLGGEKMEDVVALGLTSLFLLALLFQLLGMKWGFPENTFMYLLSSAFWFVWGQVMLMEYSATTTQVLVFQLVGYGLGMINFMFFVLSGLQGFRAWNRKRKWGEDEEEDEW